MFNPPGTVDLTFPGDFLFPSGANSPAYQPKTSLRNRSIHTNKSLNKVNISFTIDKAPKRGYNIIKKTKHPKTGLDNGGFKNENK
nr:MAG TPA: hypothetical protein [Caudoviricetes sp.]